MLKKTGMFLKRLLHALGPVIVACIFLGAVYLLYKEASKYSVAEVKASLAQIPTAGILLSLLLAVVNYAILIGYDWLALKGIHKVLPFGKVCLVSIVGQAVSFNFGAVLGGSAVRFRLYSSWGFSPVDIVRLVLMLAFAFWVGALGLVGVVFVIAPPDIPAELGVHLPVGPRELGALLALVAAAYLSVCKFVRKPLVVFGKEFVFPSFRIAVAQLLVAGADLVAAGACLYMLLPPDAGVSFIEFLPAYLMGMMTAVLSHVPGGAGVLEVVIMHLTAVSRRDVLAALLCFRVIYYLLPLLVAAVLFSLHEIHLQTSRNSGALREAARRARVFAPEIAAFAVFAAGAALCFFAAAPSAQSVVPAWASAAAGALAGASGAILLALAPGVRHRRRSFRDGALRALAVGLVGSCLHCASVGAAVVPALAIVCVLAARGHLRLSSSTALPVSPRWLLLAVGTIVCAAGLGVVLSLPDVARPIVLFLVEAALLVFFARRNARGRT